MEQFLLGASMVADPGTIGVIFIGEPFALASKTATSAFLPNFPQPQPPIPAASA